MQRVSKINHKVINLLLYRWEMLSQWGALHQLFLGTVKQAKAVGTQTPTVPDIVKTKPSKQINIIKYKIIELLPQAKFIKPDYEFDENLSAEDFIELYIKHQKMCIKKVQQLMEK